MCIYRMFMRRLFRRGYRLGRGSERSAAALRAGVASYQLVRGL